MLLPKELDCYFQAWIGLSIWHSGHPAEVSFQLFYDFVWAVRRYGYRPDGKPKKTKRAPSEQEVYEAIMESCQGSHNPEALKKEARRFQQLYTHLLAFAITPNKSKPLIEKNDIMAYFLELGGYRADPATVDSSMTQTWGTDWKKKLHAGPGLLESMRVYLDTKEKENPQSP